MAVFKDLTGIRFGKLSVIELSKEVNSGNRKRKYWLCVCDCGNKNEIRTDSLTSGKVSSCGCLKKEQEKINLTKFHRHKMSKTKLYRTWQGMKSRCCNENNKSYKRYGGRGIKVCSEWMEFDNFMSWSLSNGYEENLTIDRINNDKGYEPVNCKWSSNKEQSRNRSTNIILNHNGQSMTLIELTEKLNLPYKTIHARYKRGKRGKELVLPINE